MRRVACASFAAAAFVMTLSLANAARADVIDKSVGIKAMAGGSLWTTPSERPNNDNYEGIGFAGNGGGFSYGGGLYAEVRFIKVLSLELDLIYDKSVLMRNVDFSFPNTTATVKVQEKIDITSWRIPILAKANLPTPFGRLFVLLGPEFVRESSAEPSLEVTEGNGTVAGDPLRAESANYTMLTAGLGLTIDLPPSLEIPLELRGSKNWSQSDKFADRVEFDATNNRFTVDAQTSWDFRVSAGLGYQF
jgi:hypothetical protein